MKRILVSLLTTVMLAMSLVAPFMAEAPKAYADPADEALNLRFEATRHYDIVAAGMGLNGETSGVINLDVPGSVVQAYLYWAGQADSTNLDDFDEVSFAVGAEPAVSIVADEHYGPEFWLDPERYNFVFIEDVTSLVQSGDNDYTISGDGLAFIENYGAGLMVVYEDASLPIAVVKINDGLDSFHHDFPAPRGPDSDMTFFDLRPSATGQDANVVMFVGGVQDAARPNAIWYQTGTEPKPAPANPIKRYLVSDGNGTQTRSCQSHR